MAAHTQRRPSTPTFNAGVAGLEVAADLARARQRAVVDGGDDHRAAASPGADRVELVEHVQLAAEVAVVDRQTAAETHPAEVRRPHDDHLVVGRAAGDEHFRLAELRDGACTSAAKYQLCIERVQACTR